MGEPLGRYASQEPDAIGMGGQPAYIPVDGSDYTPYEPAPPAAEPAEPPFRAPMQLPPPDPNDPAGVPFGEHGTWGSQDRRGTVGPAGPSAPQQLPANLRPQFGSNYMPPLDEYRQRVADEWNAGHLTSGQLEQTLPTYQRYAGSTRGLRDDVERFQEQGALEQGGIQMGQLGAQDQLIARQRAAYEQQQAAAAQAEQQRQAIQARRQAAVAKAMVEYKGAVDKLDAQAVDPGRWWKDRGTAGQIMSAIAVGVGALGATWGKTPNFAFDMMQKAIDRDIDAQRMTLENKRSALAARQTLVGQLYDYFGDMDKAVAAAKDYANGTLMSQVQQIGLTSNRLSVQTQAKQLAAQLGRAHQDGEKQRALRAAIEHDQQQALAAQAAAAAANAAANKKAGLGSGEVVPGKMSMFVPARGGLVNFMSGRDAVAARNKMAAAQLVRDYGETIKAIHGEGGKWSPTERKRVDAIRAGLTDELNRLGMPEVAKGFPDTNHFIEFGVEGALEATDGIAKNLELAATAGLPVVPGKQGRLLRNAKSGEAVRAFVPDEQPAETKIGGGSGKPGRGGGGDDGRSSAEDAVDDALPDEGGK